ncbi:hypothetical protein Tco_0643422 [Tanacetum coccineum]
MKVVVEGISWASAWIGDEATGVGVWGWRVVEGSVESGSIGLGWIVSLMVGSIMVGSTVLVKEDGRMVGSSSSRKV